MCFASCVTFVIMTSCDVVSSHMILIFKNLSRQLDSSIFVSDKVIGLLESSFLTKSKGG